MSARLKQKSIQDSTHNKPNFKGKKLPVGFINSKTAKPLSKFEFQVLVNGRSFIAYRDSGSALSFVQSKLFPDVPMTGKIEIFGINDKELVTVLQVT